MRTLMKIFLVFAIIGAINWGLIGLFGVDLVALLFGEMSFLSKLVYILVGISGICSLYFLFDMPEDHHK